MRQIFKVSFTRTYNISSEEVAQHKTVNENDEQTAIRLATIEMEEDNRLGYLEPCDNNYQITVK